MSRVVKEYDERHGEFLDVAQQLFFSKGYHKTSVQEIISTVGVAKGTFYHYFDSKVDILDALVKRMYAQTLTSLEPMLADETLDAVQKLGRFFDIIIQWKTTNKDLMLDTFRVMFQDENVLLREKMQTESFKSTTPALARIIQQGVDEGVFDVEHPQETAELIMLMPQIMRDSLVSLLIEGEEGTAARARIRQQMLVFNQSVERILGTQAGTLTLVEPDILDQFL